MIAVVVWAQLAALSGMNDRSAEAYIRAMPRDTFQKYSAIIHEDDDRRYIIDRNVVIGTACAALVVRPRSATGKLPTLLQFSIYNPLMSEARRTASHGYVGVEAEPRGKQCAPGSPVPYENDGPDAVAVIDWIAEQPWSDGRVGMYGGSYNGGAQWAAAKRMPKALKAIMPQAPVAPGIDVPMEGDVTWMFVYPWTFYTTDGKANDTAVYNDRARWRRLDHDWYVSGRSFRDHDKIDGTPNPFFDRWLDHPSYDAYWQSMIPYRDEFAKVNIAVLQTAGYYFGGPGAALYYFSEHHKYNPRAEHYLVIGPYDHFRAQSGPDTNVIAGYHLDPVAMVDLRELRYQWFDYVFKNAPKPALLQSAVNYEVMGANVWKHSPTVPAMSAGTRRIHLTAATQTVDLADRSDVDRVSPGGGIVDTVIDTWNSVKTVSAPFATATEVSGLFSGSLDFIANKKDFDFQVQLYELTSKGQYIQLAPYWSRASYVGDLSQRRLLTPGKRTHLEFTSGRLMSRQMEPGSRIVIVLSILKSPGQQINFGTGKDVNDETVADGKEPLTIQWFGDSFIDVPVSPARSSTASTASPPRASR
ncbi:MAG TPA: CocE/NonD family hydrolase [Gemmatimonadaceae bacterium]|nr:CocE/NonD family hydrolase [Gemmatimonadaceae bacterium]